MTSRHCFRSKFNKILPVLLVLILAAVFLLAALVPLNARADDFWETPTPTNTPGTPTPYPVPPSSTVIATPPVALGLPGVGSYPMPTSIPAISFPPAPSPIVLDPISTPVATSTISEDDYFTSTTGFTLTMETMSDTVTLSYTSFVTLSFGNESTGTAVYTSAAGILDTGTGWISGVVSYTGWLSGEIDALQQTDTFTLASAPAWYAPDLPRPMADIGWTFETLEADIDAGARYSLDHWAWFVGYMASLPFQFIKIVFQLFQFLGPLGLFVIWLLVLLPYKLWVLFLILIKNTIISLFNAIIKLIDIILAIARTIADYFIPW